MKNIDKLKKVMKNAKDEKLRKHLKEKIKKIEDNKHVLK